MTVAGHEQAQVGAGRIGAVVGAISGLAILNVVLLPGYTWLYDMVIVADFPLSDRTLGIDRSVPRAVPNDAVVALLEKVFPGDVVQAGLLMTVLVVVGAGCARLTRSRAGAAAAALAACWNPYVVERLIIGHWAFLLGYCCLPWVHVTATRAVRGVRADWIPLLGWLALASLAGSTSAVIATITALVSVAFAADVSARARTRGAGLVVAAMGVLNAAWIVPSFARPGELSVDPAGVGAFAARADTPLGVLPSLLTLGGIWHQPSWPGSRSSGVVVAVALAVVVIVLVVCLRRGLIRELLPLGVAGLIGLLLAAASALPGGSSIVEWFVTTIPGGGLVRDSQKFVALLAIFVATATGRAVDQIIPGAGHAGTAVRNQRWILAVGLALAPVVTLPDAPTAAGQTMGSVAVSADIGNARSYLQSAEPGGVAAFPWTQYRRFGWNDDRISLDPWNRLLDRYVVVNDDLPLATQKVQGEDPVAAEISAAVDDPSQNLAGVLGRHGVRWAIVMLDQPGATAVRGQLERAGVSTHLFGDVELIDLGKPAGAQPGTGSRWPIGLTTLASVGVFGAWVLVSVLTRRGGRKVAGGC